MRQIISMEMKFDITKMVEEIAMQAKETQAEFIIETIQPYCENILQTIINKEELKQILLNGMQKQQPCEDCISRREAINVVHKYFVDYLKLNDDICLDGIRSLPSVTPHQTRWIPVSEKLPKPDEEVLVFSTAYGGYIEIASCNGTPVFREANAGNVVGDVVAWIPLPQPYYQS